MSGLLVIPAKSATIVTFLFYQIDIGITIVVGAAICKPALNYQGSNLFPFSEILYVILRRKNLLIF
jgi:hypothetical protein